MDKDDTNKGTRRERENARARQQAEILRLLRSIVKHLGIEDESEDS